MRRKHNPILWVSVDLKIVNFGSFTFSMPFVPMVQAVFQVVFPVVFPD
jgi:hypothetical protein